MTAVPLMAWLIDVFSAELKAELLPLFIRKIPFKDPKILKLFESVYAFNSYDRLYFRRTL